MAYLGHFAIVSIYIYIYISIVYKVLSIYRVLPGFREFAVFEKIKRFFYIFFGWVLQRGGQGPGKGPNQLQNRKGCRADPLSEVTRKRLKKSPQINCIILYNTVCII